MEDRIVTLKEFDFAYQADLAKALLESSGIQCMVVDEFMNSYCNFSGNALFPARLLVNREDVEKAMEILNASFESL